MVNVHKKKETRISQRYFQVKMFFRKTCIFGCKFADDEEEVEEEEEEEGDVFSMLSKVCGEVM